MGGNQSAEVGGFRIFKVNDGSPAAEAGLEVFFDFIVEINGQPMDADQGTFAQAIAQAENQRTKLVVNNIRTHTSREVYVTPRRWGGAGLLGAVVRYDSLESAEGQGMRVLSVFPNSPAHAAGLLPNKDFLLGTTEVMFRDMDELSEVVNLYLGKELKIYVYNVETESIREAVLVPQTGWGGEGAIGADIRTGFLHRIPAPRRAFSVPPQDPPEARGSPTEKSPQTSPQAAAPEAPRQDPQQLQQLLVQVQHELLQLQHLQSQQELTEEQRQHMQQFLHMQQQLQLALQSSSGDMAAQEVERPEISPESDSKPSPEGPPEEERSRAFPNGHGCQGRQEEPERNIFELPAAAKAAAAAVEKARLPFDYLAPGIIYETAVS
ncbi:unnamed protein product [Effrenium voratum]|uniref:PDZ GRASP-type domain-containing protein n=1 Tax=Effrenium voratum TaxID=2562239 RepID=A0AA36NKE2_9DINO|nr:unnamed protein product [Effrenium voratum]CAJ1462065.1 unnamed protein product [Effrenium voratum]